ncbi:MAG: winged helix DNA-binding domain-containing protein [Bacteroidota bacterium]|nr:winged helix DNA-binding domain-containing protein [Bacteroidota bacterium]
MTLDNISLLRLANQQIAETTFKTVKAIVSWMGAMQAQDYSMAKWAVGVRLPDSTDKIIETAVVNGDILRTHVMRPTWHFVSPEDIYWMLELAAPNILSAMRSRHKQLELNEAVQKKSNGIIEKSLNRGKHLTRDELFVELEKNKITTGNQRGIHILMRAELDGMVCSGATRGKQQTYALLAERVPRKKTLRKEEALAELAMRYFNSHGPATVQDFIWWSGLSVGDAKKGLESVKSNFISEEVGLQTYWFADNDIYSKKKESLYLLPAYDEFVISYKDRSAILTPESQAKAISNNGIFWPVIVVNGKIAGMWKRTVENKSVKIETEFFNSLQKTIAVYIKKKAVQFGKFIGKEVEIK